MDLPEAMRLVVTGGAGSGIGVTCQEGYESAVGGEEVLYHFDCTNLGTWEPAGLPSCVVANQCSSGEDDCDRNALCSHLGPDEHSCECDIEAGFTGDGAWCHPCRWMTHRSLSGCRLLVCQPVRQSVGHSHTRTHTRTHAHTRAISRSLSLSRARARAHSL